jgi:adenine-specific DNA-methyltransferase
MKPYYEDAASGIAIYHGRAEDVLPTLPDGSIDLIATDPPFFGMKDEAWDNQWDSPEAFIAWMGSLCVQWRRVLKPNGSLYVFASPEMGDRVSVEVRRHFNVLTNIRWRKPPFATKAEMFRKEDLRAPFPASEWIVFAEQMGTDEYADDASGYSSQCESAKRATFGDYLRAEMKRAGVTNKEVATLFPSVSGGLTGCVRNWLLGMNVPTNEQWQALRDHLNQKPGNYLTREYESLRREYESLRREYESLRREYESLRRPFFVSEFVPYTDVWDFSTVGQYPGKHPCEKPLSMMEHIISVSSRPGDMVLDCFLGSGATLRAARNLGRRGIGVEQDERWCRVAVERQRQGTLFGAAS